MRCVLFVLALLGAALGKKIVVRFGPTEQYPAVVRLDRTDCVVWQNTGRSVHTVQAIDRSFDSGFLSPGEQFEQCFLAEGVYEYQDGVRPAQRSIVVVGDVKFRAPPLVVPEHTLAPPRREVPPVQTKAEPTAAPGVLIGATRVVLQPEGDVTSNQGASELHLVADFSGSPGRGQAVAVISDGCNELRSAVDVVQAGDRDVRFGPFDVRSLADGALETAIVVDGERYSGPVLNKAIADAAASAADAGPQLAVTNIAYSSL
eukprot:TRINITY_DN2399_c0_g1_i1.p2 TRINITY_DN2399_c0_g1~~TRINITY_DN2399_c0_g1_i1.p2  ORF type:complete len:260 (-),score=125.87 TRINITY_DN2399_c0_g1_i1:77-856(-)